MEKLNYWALIISVLAIIVFGLFHLGKILPVVFENNDAENYQNATAIKLGMTKKQMLDIMGEPDTLYNGYFYNASKSSEVYVYENRLLASNDITINLDSNGTVHSVYRND